jgi:hypothetical protein
VGVVLVVGEVVVVGVVVVVGIGVVVVEGVVVEDGVVVDAVEDGVVVDAVEDELVAGAAPPKSWRYLAAPIGNCVSIRRCAPSEASNSKYIWKATLFELIQSYICWMKYALSPPPWPSERIERPHSGIVMGLP